MTPGRTYTRHRQQTNKQTKLPDSTTRTIPKIDGDDDEEGLKINDTEDQGELKKEMFAYSPPPRPPSPQSCGWVFSVPAQVCRADAHLCT